MSDLIERLRALWTNDDCAKEAADLLEANAAEIERLKAENKRMRADWSRNDDLWAENEKLRTVQKASEDVCQTLEHETAHVTSIQMWRLREALAAVEQSEGLHSHEMPSEVADTLDAALRDSVTVVEQSEAGGISNVRYAKRGPASIT